MFCSLLYPAIVLKLFGTSCVVFIFQKASQPISHCQV